MNRWGESLGTVNGLVMALPRQSQAECACERELPFLNRCRVRAHSKKLGRF